MGDWKEAPQTPLGWCQIRPRRELRLSSPPASATKCSCHSVVLAQATQEPGFPQPRGTDKAPRPHPTGLACQKRTHRVRTFSSTNNNEATPTTVPVATTRGAGTPQPPPSSNKMLPTWVTVGQLGTLDLYLHLAVTRQQPPYVCEQCQRDKPTETEGLSRTHSSIT